MKKIREHIIGFLKEELVGPSSSLTLNNYSDGYDIPELESPRSRYGAGILFPRKAFVSSQEDIDLEKPESQKAPEAAVEEETPEFTASNFDPSEVTDKNPENDFDITLANQYLPSAMGLTTLMDISIAAKIEVSGAWYMTNQAEAPVNPGQWKRTDFNFIAELDPAKLRINQPFDIQVNGLQPDGRLRINVYSRRTPADDAPDSRMVTFTLVNDNLTERDRPRDQDCYYQCSLRIISSSEPGAFLEYPEQQFKKALSDEEQSLALLYRHRKVFAVGHGCATGWSANDGDSRSSEIRTEVLPEYEVRPVLPTDLPGLNLDMWHLSEVNEDSVIKECNFLADKYEEWIALKTAEAKILPDRFSSAAHRHLEECKKSCERIRAGIEILKKDHKSFLAFSLMNKVMRMQDIHYGLATKKVRRWIDKNSLSGKFQVPDYTQGPKRKWRPFQLAFILMTMRSIVEEGHEDREIVDLIWFPTGGGKTEAYLGLTAFTIFFRRLCDKDNAGTAAFMRYTLRLLTTQQFQRAASLICAMEKIRRDDPQQFGTAPITIGLWVGSGVTPNKEEDAKSRLNELARKGGENSFILTSCPWCGAEMGRIEPQKGNGFIRGYRKLLGPDRVRHVCDDSDCEFSKVSPQSKIEGLPVRIIDEHIYNSPPTLLVGTVDKFAMMPWIPEARKLFGIDVSERCDPPWLIIQDEMHLISGPLGSMVGHYETLVDALCERNIAGKKIKAKVVASTATISNAPDQIEKLFCRKKSVLFPSQGLKAGDSFFAIERNDLPGRKYVGVFATGLPSQMTTMVRTVSSMVQAPVTGAYSEDEIDPYWTQMIYFNSIRELGHAFTLVRGDIPEYLSVIANKRLELEKDSPKRRYIKQPKELTSRIASHEVASILGELFKQHHKEEDAIDVCLATNMIQVGLDVSRLSLMVIAGQPKTTSEYIQASSRVGREAEIGPGLVVTVLNPAKPRDRSHYEHFKAYHQSFYRYVEPTSVTPFAIPVRDRALHALVIALVRFLGGDDLRKNPGLEIDETLKERITKIIRERAHFVDPDEEKGTLDQLDLIWKRWKRLHAARYGYFGSDDVAADLMVPANNQFEDTIRKPFPTPTSMRNVDASCEAGIIAAYDIAEDS